MLSSTEGIFGGSISFDHSDANEDPYDLVLQGTVSEGTPPPIVQIIDDGDAGYQAVGMVDWVSGGYLGDLDYAAAGTGSSQATWTFAVASGRYRVAATWVAHPNRAIDSPYTIYDGSGELAQVDINQKLDPNDFSDAGGNWENLATVDVLGSTLNVTLTNQASNYVIADAVRIERIGDAVVAPEIDVLDGTLKIPDGGTVNFGNTTTSVPVNKVLTVKNLGTDDLTLEPLDETAFPTGFTLVENFTQTTLAPRATTTFIVQMGSTSEGVFDGAISFDHSDSNENPYDLVLQGSVFDGPPPPVVQIIDDGESGYTAVDMVDWSTGGYLGDLDYAAAGTGSSFATWDFPVGSGRYRVAATWVPHPNRAIDSPYTIFDGMTERAQVDVNQVLPPGDFNDAGADWEDLATVDVLGSTLSVKLTNQASSFVIADAIRIERIGNVAATPLGISSTVTPESEQVIALLAASEETEPDTEEARDLLFTTLGQQETDSAKPASGAILGDDAPLTSLAEGLSEGQIDATDPMRDLDDTLTLLSDREAL
jgi:hypothetical protein